MTAAALPQSQEPYEVPEGGLASFLTATVGDWSDEAINSDNYYDIVKPTAEQLAAFGRVGDDGRKDDRIAHVATGETVIPMAVFEKDPVLKESLFQRMREMGLEPEQYIVGNKLNSINPVTGQPEFILKKIFKGIKKAVKGVVKVFKKIAPIVLSIGLAMTPLGPIAGAALGSGLGTLIQGGSLKDAFKAALIGGAMGGLSSGIGSVMKGGGFLEGVQAGLPGGAPPPTVAPMETATPTVDLTAAEAAGPQIMPPQSVTEAALKDAAGAASTAPITAEQAIQEATRPQGGFFSPEGGAGTLSQSANTAADIAAQEAAKLKAQGIATGTANTNLTAGLTPPGAPSYATPGASAKTIAQSSLERAAQTAESATPVPASSSVVANTVQQTADRTFLQKVSDYMFRAGQSPAEVNAAMASAKADTIRETLASLEAQGITGQVAQQAALKAGEQAAKAAAPGLLAKYGPLTAAGLGIMKLAGGFEQPEMEDLSDYNAFGRESVPYPFVQPGSNYQPLGAAKGGKIEYFPRKNGAIYGPGTETSDDIPAMLSDGEFVMTAKAVRGAGNGSREVGMRRMYDMMRKFEGGAARGN